MDSNHFYCIQKSDTTIDIACVQIPLLKADCPLLEYYNVKPITEELIIFATHLKALRSALENGEKRFVVFESNLHLHNNFKALMQFSTNGCINLSYTVHNWNDSKWQNQSLFTLPSHQFSGMSMYFVTKDYALELLRKYDRPHPPELQFRFSEAQLHYPPLAIHSNSYIPNYHCYHNGEKLMPNTLPYLMEKLEFRLTQHSGPLSGPANVVDVSFVAPFEHYHPMNWVLVKTLPGDPHLNDDEQYYGLVRFINNIVQWHNSNTAVISDGTSQYRSKLVLFAIAKDYRARFLAEIVDAFNAPRSPTRFIGWEDCRNFERTQAGEIHISGTNCELSIDGLPQIALGKINLYTFTLTQVHVIPRRPGVALEKNWLPFCLTEDTAKLIWSLSPPTLISVNLKTLECSFRETAQPILCPGFKGSCAPIPFESGWLAMGHTTRIENGNYIYRHQLIWLNKDYIIKKVSYSFYFEFNKLEFCLGWNLFDDHILITTSSADYYPKMITLSLSEIPHLLVKLQMDPKAYLCAAKC